MTISRGKRTSWYGSGRGLGSLGHLWGWDFPRWDARGFELLRLLWSTLLPCKHSRASYDPQSRHWTDEEPRFQKLELSRSKSWRAKLIEWTEFQKFLKIGERLGYNLMISKRWVCGSGARVCARLGGAAPDPSSSRGSGRAGTTRGGFPGLSTSSDSICTSIFE